MRTETEGSTIWTPPAGFTFYFTRPQEDDPQNHARVVISKTWEEDLVVVVSVTKYAQFKDTSCVIEVGEHECVTVRSVIGYGFAKPMTVAKLREWVHCGEIEPKRPVSKELLFRILDGAAKTKNLPIGLRSILEDQDLVPR